MNRKNIFIETHPEVQEYIDSAVKNILNNIKKSLSKKRYTDEKYHDAVLWKDILKELNR